MNLDFNVNHLGRTPAPASLPGAAPAKPAASPSAPGLTITHAAASPEDVAAAVAFLAGPDAAYVSGQTLAVCGGMI